MKPGIHADYEQVTEKMFFKSNAAARILKLGL